MNALLLALSLLAAPEFFQEDSGKGKGSIEKFKEPFRQKKEQEGEHPREAHERPRSGDGHDGFWEAVFEDFFAAAILYPFADHGLRYQDYPYAGGGNYFMNAETSDKIWAADVSFGMTRVEHDLIGYRMTGDMNLPSGCDLRFDISQYVERREGRDDRLTLQEYEMNYGLGGTGHGRPVQATIGWSVGVLDVNEENFTDIGAGVQGTLLWYVAPPVSLRMHVGAIGFSSDTLTDLQLEAGLHGDRFALTVGVRSLINSEGDDLTGPTFGLSVFF